MGLWSVKMMKWRDSSSLKYGQQLAVVCTVLLLDQIEVLEEGEGLPDVLDALL
jgi:hypothetical protein